MGSKSKSAVETALQKLSKSPERIFEYSNKSDKENEFNSIVKSLLDPLAKDHSVLDEIYVDGLDATQVFGQSNMIFEGVSESLLFTKIPELKAKFSSHVSDDEDEDVEESAQSEEAEEENEDSDAQTLNGEEEFDGFTEDEKVQKDDDDEEDEEQESDTETNVPSDSEETSEPVKDVFGLNDEFFDIDSFNKQSLQLDDMENDDPEGDDEQIDYFDSLSDEDEEDEDMAYYGDFFSKPGQKTSDKTVKSSKAEDSEDEYLEDDKLDEKEYDNAVGSAMNDLFADEDEIDAEEQVKGKREDQMSSFEKQQQQIQAEIANLEAELVADKKWTMKGEISSKDRPVDSLLDDPESNNLEFDRTSKPVPVITDEVTESIEDLIRRRIKNEEFDDLPKRVISDVSKFHNKTKFELSDQKLTKSLAEQYEDDYNNIDSQQIEINEQVKEQHDEISELFGKVNHHLDALTSAHFVPKPHQFRNIDIKVTDTTAAASINMEDAQPTHVSSETTLAPQEIYKIGDEKPQADGANGRSEVQLKSGLSYSKDELSRDDKQRLRRSAKRKKSKHFNEKRDLQEQQQKQDANNGGDHKRQKVGQVIDTLSKAKNVTVIGKKGEMRDVKGNVRKSQLPQNSSNFKL